MSVPIQGTSSKRERPLTDCELVERARSGDDEAFEMLFEQYNRRIGIYIARMVGDDGVGCELTQETFIKAWQSLPRLRDAASFESWLYRIATRIAYDHQQHIHLIHWLRWDQYIASPESDKLHVVGPEDGLAEAELLKIALAQVSLTYRASLVLFIVEELPQRLIAERLGIKENSVSKYVSRGVEELRRIFLRLTNELNTDEKVGGRR